MKVICDDKIPYLRGALEPFSEVVYLPGAQTMAEAVRDADALVTRTRTICSRETLEGSNVRFIATATVGFDHIDTSYCARAGIEWANAPGCNAESVNQYVASALCSYARDKEFDLHGKTIGIVGVGNVGSRVAKTCEILGMEVLLNDPPRQRREGPGVFVPLSAIKERADIISFHVPLNMDGVDKTWHMVNAAFLRGLGKRPRLLNTCRGEVFDTGAVLEAAQRGTVSGLVIDVWESEPGLDLGLLELVDYATPHIAGYSRDGKANGTMASVRAISRFFGLGIDDWTPLDVEPPPKPLVRLDGAGKSEFDLLSEAMLSTYQIRSDDRALRKHTNLFEQLRGDYPVRREFSAHAIHVSEVASGTLGKLGKLGFRTQG